MAMGTSARTTLTLTLTLTFASFIATALGQGLTSCEYDADSCGCKTNKGLISLKKYEDKGLTYVDTSSSAEYTWNPCKDVSIGLTDAACIQAFPPILSYDCGTHDSTTSSVKSGYATFNLKATVESRQSEIKCTCKSGEKFSFVKEDPPGYYYLEWTLK
ncbi:hypothetical protein EGW08_007607 [Elysia chlorotica]|uniref:Uncharacterized protein n=1 Tax=Elysia chlorotica TaxID=188477 RepID=A0A433TST8_ELYCH|nr:hypothetical protein EGW08_007607 [Elysia chlorotica]